MTNPSKTATQVKLQITKSSARVFLELDIFRRKFIHRMISFFDCTKG